MIVAAVQDMRQHFFEHSRHRRAPLCWAREAMMVDLDVALFQWFTDRAGSGSQKKRSAEGQRRRKERDKARFELYRASKAARRDQRDGEDL